jgi:hypothetical protein
MTMTEQQYGDLVVRLGKTESWLARVEGRLQESEKKVKSLHFWLFWGVPALVTIGSWVGWNWDSIVKSLSLAP